MHIVAMAGSHGAGKTTLATALTGNQQTSHRDAKGPAISTVTAHTPFTLIDTPGNPDSPQTSMTGWLLADVVVLVLRARLGWTQEAAEQLEIFSSMGVHGVMVALVSDDDSSVSHSMEHAVRQQLGNFQIPVTCIVTVGHAASDIDAINENLQMVLNETPALTARGIPRFWVQSTFQQDGKTVATGILTGNSLSLEDELVVPPSLSQSPITSIQDLNQNDITEAERGSLLTLHLPGLDEASVQNAKMLVRNRATLSNTVDAQITALANTEGVVQPHQVYRVQLGAWTGHAMIIPEGGTTLSSGEQRYARMRFAHSLPLKLGDRIAVSDINTGQLMASGSIREVNLPFESVDLPNVEHLLRSRGWIDVREFHELTGIRRSPTVGNWVVDLVALEECASQLRQTLAHAGANGIDINSLNEQERALLQTLSGIEIAAGRARLNNNIDLTRPMNSSTLEI